MTALALADVAPPATRTSSSEVGCRRRELDLRAALEVDARG